MRESLNIPHAAIFLFVAVVFRIFIDISPDLLHDEVREVSAALPFHAVSLGSFPKTDVSEAD